MPTAKSKQPAPSAAENPKTVSWDYKQQANYWRMVGAILHGVEALRQVAGQSGKTEAVSGPVVPFASLAQLNSPRRGRNGAQSPWLPQFPSESNADYDIRRQNAPLTNIYGDISRNLASKPFSKTLEIDETSVDGDIVKLESNIDGQGNNLHVFAQDLFKTGLDKGIDWILVDYKNIDAQQLTLADERSMGLRPYWVHIPCERVLAVYSDFINGQEVLTHVRIYEPVRQRDGYDEEEVERVRIFNREPIYRVPTDDSSDVVGYGPATWQLLELITTLDDNQKEKQEWSEVGSGLITIKVIPMVPFRTGKRDGLSWKIDPPLRDLAYMQIEEFQQESNLKTIKELTAFPMLAGDGVTPPKDSQGEDVVVPVGPRAVLFAPPSLEGRASGGWHFIEPAATSLTFLATDLEKLRTEMRDIGMQPLTASNLTVITTANLSMKAHNSVQAWALQLKDSLEQAIIITGMWMNKTLTEPVVNVHTDFGVDLDAQTELPILLTAESQGVISKLTVQEEFKRRGVLNDDFDPDEEQKRLADQQAQLSPEVAIDPITGKALDPTQSTIARKQTVLPAKPTQLQ